MDDKMSEESRPHEEDHGSELNEPRQSDPDAEGEESPPAPAIIPGNVGSLDDVPSDVMEGEMPAVDDEGM